MRLFEISSAAKAALGRGGLDASGHVVGDEVGDGEVAGDDGEDLGRPVTGRAIDWHWFFDWEAEESEKKFCVALPTMPSMVVHGLMVESESVEQSDAVDEAP